MEILDIVNEIDEIIGKAPYETIHAEKSLHRVVSAILINNHGEVLLQLRAKSKSAYPLHWSFSMGGHVRHGENYGKAIVREAKEEIEVTLLEKDFVYRGKRIVTEHSGAKVQHALHEVRYDGPIQETKNEEVAAVQFVDFPTLKKMIDEKKVLLHPQMIEMLQSFYRDELS